MVETRLRQSEDRGIHHITMAHGANALDPQLVDDLQAAFRRLAERDAPPVLLGSSHPRIFSPGWDLKALAAAGRDEVQGFLTGFNNLIFEVFSYPGPTAVAINGHAVAGGCLLAMACDLRVMASGGARMGLSEVNLGVPVPAGCLSMLRARLAPGVVDELVFAGDGFTAERARELGLVYRVASPEGLSRVASSAVHTLAAKPRSAVVHCKRFLLEASWSAMSKIGAAEDEAFLDCWFEEGTQGRIHATARRLSS